MGILLTSLLASAWLLVLLIVLIVLIVVGAVLVRFLLVATVAVSTWAEAHGADPRTYWWPFRPGDRKPRSRPASQQRHAPAAARPAEAAASSPETPAPVHEEHPVAAGIRARFTHAAEPSPIIEAPAITEPEAAPPAAAVAQDDRTEVLPMQPETAQREPATPEPAHETPAPAVAARPTRRPAPRTRPASRPVADDTPPAEEPASDERDSALDRLFAPLAESDRTEPLPAVKPRTPRTTRQPRP